MTPKSNSMLLVGEVNPKIMHFSLLSWKRKGQVKTPFWMPKIRKSWFNKTKNSEILKISNLDNKSQQKDDVYFIC